MFERTGILAILLILTAPGSGFAESPTVRDLRAVTFQAHYFDKGRNRIGADTLAQAVLLKIRLIPGSPSGVVMTPPIASIPVRIGEPATLDLDAIRGEVERSATTLTPEASAGGLSIVPKRTRIARLGTFVYESESMKGITSGFQGAQGERVYIVYFDRACELTGVHRQQGMTMTYGVKVSVPGFNLLKIAQETASGFRTTLTALPGSVDLALLPFGSEYGEALGSEPRMYVTPRSRKTFGPKRTTPAGTVFYIRVLEKSENDAIQLHRCQVPCNTAVTVKIWAPKSYQAGDQLSWRVDRDGEYYFWIRDRTGAASYESADELVDEKLRIRFASGAVLDAWYVAPPAAKP